MILPILTDVDGVLVNWLSNLPYFLRLNHFPYKHILEVGDSTELSADFLLEKVPEEDRAMYIVMYNSTHYIETLTPYNDAVEFFNKYSYVPKIAATAMQDTQASKFYRKSNLELNFGSFQSINHTGFDKPKKPLFQYYKDNNVEVAFYIDDTLQHVIDFGHMFQDKVSIHIDRTEILLSKPYLKKNYNGLDYYVVNSWEGVDSLIIDKIIDLYNWID